MTLHPLSDTALDDFISILKSDPVFMAKTEAEQILFLNTIAQDVCDLYCANGLRDYEVNNLSDPLMPGTEAVTERRGWATASIAGTPVVFTEGPLIDAVYGLLVSNSDVDFTSPDGTDSRTRYGFIAYAARDGVTFFFLAKEP